MRNVLLCWIGARGLRWLAGAIVVAMLIGAASAHAQLVIRICGTNANPCASDPTDDNLDSAKIFGDIGQGGVVTQVDVKNGTESERVPTTASTPVPAPSAPATLPMGAGPYNEAQMGAATCCRSDDGGLNCGGIYQACSVCISAYAPLTGGRTCKVTSAGGTSIPVATKFQTDNYSVGAVNPNGSCPPGTTDVSGVCQVTDARAVTADGKLDFERTGETFGEASLADVDSSVFLDNDSVGKIVGSTYQRSGFAPTGGAVHVEIVPVAGGGSKVIYTESKDGVVRQTTVGIGPSGSVTSKVTGVGAGDLTPAPLAGTAAISAAPGVATPGTGGGTASGLGDYAKAGEAAAAGSGIEGKLDTLHDDLTGDGAGTDLAAAKQAYEDAADAHKGLLDGLGGKGQSDEGGLLTWLLPNPVAQDNTCTDPSVTIASGLPSQKTVTITGYCNTAGKVRALLGWVLYILTSYGLFAIATGRHTA